MPNNPHICFPFPGQASQWNAADPAMAHASENAAHQKLYPAACMPWPPWAHGNPW